MIDLTPWYYRNLLKDSVLISKSAYYKSIQINGEILFESVISLNQNLIPAWVSISTIYSSSDGSGTSPFQNIAVYKAISEALERWAFYGTADSLEAATYCFDVNPSTTGMAAYPGFTARNARKNAILEASERWALHEFWRGNLPIKEHESKIKNLKHFEIITDFQDVRVSLVCYKSENYYLYAFAADKSLNKSFGHALVELARNIRVMKKFSETNKHYTELEDISDKRLVFFANSEGHEMFMQKILGAPSTILVKPQVICDKEIKGPWSQYTRVWRYLYANSFPDSETDHTFFMF